MDKMTDESIIYDVKLIFEEQRKCGIALMKAIKADPPSTRSRSLIGWSDALTTKYLNLLVTNKDIIVQGEVNNRALEYAKSIYKYKDYLHTICEGKSQKEKMHIISLCDGCKIKHSKLKKIPHNHWSDNI